MVCYEEQPIKWITVEKRQNVFQINISIWTIGRLETTQIGSMKLFLGVVIREIFVDCILLSKIKSETLQQNMIVSFCILTHVDDKMLFISLME